MCLNGVGWQPFWNSRWRPAGALFHVAHYLELNGMKKITCVLMLVLLYHIFSPPQPWPGDRSQKYQKSCKTGITATIFPELACLLCCPLRHDVMTSKFYDVIIWFFYSREAVCPHLLRFYRKICHFKTNNCKMYKYDFVTIATQSSSNPMPSFVLQPTLSVIRKPTAKACLVDCTILENNRHIKFVPTQPCKYDANGLMNASRVSMIKSQN